MPKRHNTFRTKDPEGPAITLADWFRWKLTRQVQSGWTPTIADFERDRHASD